MIYFQFKIVFMCYNLNYVSSAFPIYYILALRFLRVHFSNNVDSFQESWYFLTLQQSIYNTTQGYNNPNTLLVVFTTRRSVTGHRSFNMLHSIIAFHRKHRVSAYWECGDSPGKRNWVTLQKFTKKRAHCRKNWIGLGVIKQTWHRDAYILQ